MMKSRFVVNIALCVLFAIAQSSVASDTGVALSPQSRQMTKEHDGEIIKQGDLLTLERCIEIALKRQPAIISARSAVDVSQSRIGQAQAAYYPQIDLSAGYSRINPVSSTSTRSGNISSNPYDQYSSSASLRQTIFDFGKTPSQVSVQRLNLEASRSDLENANAQIVFNVKQAYYGVLQTKKNRDVAEEAVKQFEQHLQQAKGFYEVGIKPKFDVTKAEVDLSNARLNLIKAENAYRLAIAQLNHAIGVSAAPSYSIEDTMLYKKSDITMDDAFSRAFENRPDLQTLISKRKASEESIALAKTGYYPTVSGNAAYNWSGSRFPLEDGWSVGATLTFPLFSGFLTKQQVGEAEANLNVVKANEDLIRQNIFLEVKQAFLIFKEAEERIPAADLTVKQAKENLDIANGRYAAGVGNPIEVTDAQVAYSNAKTAYIQALSDYNVAEASLVKAMGGK